MSFSDLKISEATIQSTGVQSQPDTLTGSAPDNKLVFDALPTLIIQKLNNLLDMLGGTDAATEMPIEPIDDMTAKTVQQALVEIRQALTAYIDKISGTGGAAAVGVSGISGMQAENTQAALAELKAMIDNLVIGALPSGSVSADMIADDAIIQLGALLAVATAAAYDPEGSYAVGDYCTHGGKLHKCGTEIPDGEAWNAAHWTATTVAAELAGRLSRSGGLMSGPINWGNNRRVSGGSTETEFDFAAGKASIRLIPQNAVGNDISKCVAIRDTGNGNLYYIATATPPQEVPLPLVSGVSELNVATAEKTQEGIVLVNAWVGFDSPVIANTETQVAIMPENMRPKKTVGVTALVDSGADKNLGFARISIDSGGVVRILSDISFSFAVFSIAYPAAN